MFSLEDLLGNQKIVESVSQISSQIGVDPNLASKAAQISIPILIDNLAKNASSMQETQSLEGLLQNIDTSILDNLQNFASAIFNSEENSQKNNAVNILNHILGDRQTDLVEKISHQSGLGTEQVIKILMFIAPILLSYLGKQKSGMDSANFLEMLCQYQRQIQQSSIGELLTQVLDKDKDGSIIDDITASSLKRFIS